MGEEATAEELFDALGAEYEEAFGARPLVDAAIRELVAELAPESKVLDLGSGTGRPLASELAAAGHHVTGLDVSAEMVRIAREQVPAAEFLHVDVREWESEAASWDAVCAFFSFVQLTRAETEGLLGKVAAWLKPGGQLVLITVPGDIEDLPIEFLGHAIRVTSFAPEDLENRVRAAGLEVTGTRSEVFEPGKPGAQVEEHLLITARKP
ncbi:class I SAM-dependent methyltransferase [Amycolatopsis rhabdoformis]|uniref:Class I SAM-dependent methyltransferase n=1 Tax=Amycolatopsis rhabdoformis TaxID=1448059 RepID=A0ABZ1IAP2_9PSEU|nr:class I SAM-dependent methyltransferase [Amycolatopsis rhabdoformis]WSE31482.1 class I SAM-dependent methyltransferase [Amycolatopsis rhabdoformis]